MALGIITGLLLSSCGQEARRITVVTPFLVKNPAQPTHANVAELVNAESTVTATPPTTLPPGVSSAYCFQPDLRMSYSDPRPGYPSFSGRINLITEKTASPWSSPATGPIGLNDAISLLRNPAKSFLPAPITLDLPVTSQGTIRIDGTLVRPSGTTQVVCPNNDASANIESYAVWGEAKIQPGGSSTVTVPLSVISTTPKDATGSIPYNIPTITGNTITNPIGASDIKCRNLTSSSTCMNRNLLEFKFHITSASGPNNNEYVFEARGLSEWDTFEARVPVHVDQYGQYQFYLPKRNLYLLQYTLINGGDSVEVWIDFAQKKYRYSINSSPPVNLDLKDCSLGRFALTIPVNNSGTLTTPSAPANCAFGSASSNPNLIVSDLGYGF